MRNHSVIVSINTKNTNRQTNTIIIINHIINNNRMQYKV